MLLFEPVFGFGFSYRGFCPFIFCQKFVNMICKMVLIYVFYLSVCLGHVSCLIF